MSEPGRAAQGGGCAAVLFDVDDTLVDFAGAARLALADVVREHLSPGTTDEVPGAADPESLLDAAHPAWQRVSDTEYGSPPAR